MRLLVGTLICAYYAFACLSTRAADDGLTQIRQRLADTLDSASSSQGWWGVSAICLDNGLGLFSTNESRHFTPASTTKLFTVALALQQLGGDFRIRTSVMASTNVDTNGVLHGDLAVVGRGDPTMSFHFRSGNGTLADTSLIGAITQAGVKSIDGRLLFDGSWLKAAPYGSGWEWDDLVEGYGAPVSAFPIHENVSRLSIAPGEHINDPARLSWQPANPLLLLDFQVSTLDLPNQRSVIEYHRIPGSPSLQIRGACALGSKPWFCDFACPDPARWFANRFRSELVSSGVPVGETNCIIEAFEISPVTRGGWHEIAMIQSPPISDLAALTLKPSQNLLAQLLLLHVGEKHLNSAAKGADPHTRADQEAAGIRELNRWLASLGIVGTDVALEEGSGLSRRNTITPRAVSNLLRHMATNHWSESWLKALPVGGVDGTLQGRFTDGPGRNRVHAKTGSLRGVQALAGYVTTAAGQPVAFAIYANQFNPAESSKVRRTIDQLVTELAGYTNHLGEISPARKN